MISLAAQCKEMKMDDMLIIEGRKWMEIFLQYQNIRCHNDQEAEDLAAAIEASARKKFKQILIDLCMPQIEETAKNNEIYERLRKDIAELLEASRNK